MYHIPFDKKQNFFLMLRMHQHVRAREHAHAHMRAERCGVDCCSSPLKVNFHLLVFRYGTGTGKEKLSREHAHLNI